MKRQEWSVLLHSFHTLGTDHKHLRAFAEDLLDALEPYHAVTSYDPLVIAARFNVMASPMPADAVAKATEIMAKALKRIGFPDSVSVVWAEAQTVEALDRELQRSNAQELVGISEIAGMLGVTRQRALEVTRREDFPKPIAALAAGPIWNRHAVARFVERWPRKRTGRPRLSGIRMTAGPGAAKQKRV